METMDSSTPIPLWKVGAANEDREDFDVAVVGLGYVGMPQVIEASRVGLRVVGLDIDLPRVETLLAGHSYVDDVSDQDVASALVAGFQPTTNPKFLALSDAILICVPTPLGGNNKPDVSPIVEAGRTVGEHLQKGQLVVLESTSFPGTTEEVLLPVLEEASGLKAGVDFSLASAPERIDPGGPWVLKEIPKLVGGIDAASTDRAAALFDKFCDTVVRVSGTREAEMAKMIENTYRSVNIALVNELMMISERLGVDVWEALQAAGTKPFGFQEFRPGPGVGGHCIPVDPHFLTERVRELGGMAPLAEMSLRINEAMPHYAVERAERLLAEDGESIEGAQVLLLGVSYKANIADTRLSPANDIARELRRRGAIVSYHDPRVLDYEVDGKPLVRHDDPVTASAQATLVIMVADHNEYDLRSIALAANRILDTRGVFPRAVSARL